MLIKNITNRWAAAAIHLAISLLVLGVLLIVITQYWYPGVFINMGGYQGIKIVAGVDIVLGPLLTLIVYNVKKKSLKLDLIAIASCQILALAGGMYLVHNERPMIQLITDRGLEIITYGETKNHSINYKKLDSSLPAFFYLQLPDNDSDIRLARTAGEFLGEPLEYRYDLYKLPQHGLDTTMKTIVDKLPFDQGLECYWMPVVSDHWSGDACVDLELGAIATRST